MLIKSPSGINLRATTYEDFQGIDRSRDRSAMDTGSKQHLWVLRNGYCDWRGVITRDPGAFQRSPEGNKYVQHVQFFGRDLVCWAQRDGGGVTLKSERGQEEQEAFPPGSVVTSTVFNSEVIFTSRDQRMRSFDGIKFKTIENTTPQRPAYAVAVQRRLAIAGQPGKRTVIDFSRVDDYDVFPDDEEENSESVLKAADIDVRNVIGTADEIRGLATFENNRLAVFTYDQTLLYRVHPDYTKWELEDRVNIRVGTISHNSIVQVGSDLIFCSRHGVHSLRRSDTNGITVYSIPMSSKIDLLYRNLIRQTEDLESISSWYDPINGQYHVHFPVSSQLTQRLTMTIDPSSNGAVKWSTGDFLQATCGAHLGGISIVGTSGGVWQYKLVEEETEVSPDLYIETPILWQGSINDQKQSSTLVMQATGKGRVIVNAYDESGRHLSRIPFEIETDSEDDSFPDVPLSVQYERRFEHLFRGVRLVITAEGSGLVKIIGFAITVRS